MKKSLNILFGALAVVLMASCAKEEALLKQNEESGKARTFTVSFEQTKTDLVEGKTVWLKGDSIWVSNGRAVEYFAVPESAAGKKEFSFTSKLGGAIYVVYPKSAAEGNGVGLVEDKIVLDVSSNQDGTFGSANVCVARTLDESVVLKNVTAVMKFTVPDDALIPIKAVTLHANGDALTGLCTIDLSSDTPVVTSSMAGSDVFIPVEGLTGDYYASVIPGSYKAGFTITALTTAMQVDSKVSANANEIKINELVDLGNIGKDIKKMDGDGSAANPWTINNFGEMMAFAYYVNAGNDLAGENVKLNADIDGYSLPIGYTDPVSGVTKVFKGNFDGNGKTIKLSILGKNAINSNKVALFGILRDGATIKNLTVEGTIAAADTVGGVAALVECTTSPVVFEGVTSKVDVSGDSFVGGVAGYVDGKVVVTDVKAAGTIENKGSYTGGVFGYAVSASGKESEFSGLDVNSKVTGDKYAGGVIGRGDYLSIADSKVAGSVTGLDDVGGFVGFSKYATVSDSDNKASVTSTTKSLLSAFILPAGSAIGTGSAADGGVGGIFGFAQNGSVQFCSNSGAITGFVKVAGIVGEAYWTPVNGCKNKGAITATGDYSYKADSQSGYQFGSTSAGITGYVYAMGSITNCVNDGVVKGKGGIGGIVGGISCTENLSSVPTIKNCINNANIISEKPYSGGTQWVYNPGTGGICGEANSYCKSTWKTGSTPNRAKPTFINCINNGNVSTTGSSTSNKVSGIVGGIIGKLHSYGNLTNAGGEVEVNGCYNTGNVTGDYYVGGILGLATGPYYGQPTLKNCGNTGNVTANAMCTNATNIGVHAGGILGGVQTWNTNSKGRVQINIWNCYNNGDVLYAKADAPKPYVGGIIGEGWTQVSVINTYNSGTVGLISGTPADGAAGFVGALVGWQNNAGTSFSYYPNTITIAAVNGGAAAASIATYDELGNLNKTVEPRSTPASTLLDALNTWANTSAYYKWITSAKGPKFADPVGSGIDAGNQNLDLGNGGNI